jgi:hypothetical protein
VPQFFYYTGRIQSQLKSAPGLIGYSLLAHVREKRFWTLSVWENDAALERFVGQQPHRQAMLGLRRAMGATAFARWRLKGAAVPPSWREAMRQVPMGARAESANRERY